MRQDDGVVCWTTEICWQQKSGYYGCVYNKNRIVLTTKVFFGVFATHVDNNKVFTTTKL
jgi:hypothetical protein